MDNGPELTSPHFLSRSIERKVGLMHIQPGEPTQNGKVESFNGRFRDECLNVNWFVNLHDARRKIARWREEYNRERPHSSFGYLTPEQFAALANPASTAGQFSIETGQRGLTYRPLATAPPSPLSTSFIRDRRMLSEVSGKRG